ncbi:hypothetical protein GQ457_04G016550 [Hibiscus cannabinus]
MSASKRRPRIVKILFTFDSLQSLHSNSREECVKRNIYLFDIERIKLKKQVNMVHVRDQKHELTPSRNRYPCDNGYKEVTVLPSRDIVYDQVKQLIGLRHKPITQQDALPRSDSQLRFFAKAGPLSLFETSPFSSCSSRISKPLHRTSRSIDSNSCTTLIFSSDILK